MSAGTCLYCLTSNHDSQEGVEERAAYELIRAVSRDPALVPVTVEVVNECKTVYISVWAIQSWV